MTKPPGNGGSTSASGSRRFANYLIEPRRLPIDDYGWGPSELAAPLARP